MVRSYGVVLVVFVLLSAAGLYLLVEFGKVASVPSFSSQSRSALAFVLFCLADGALTMVLVQLCRSVVPIRGRFHRSVLHWWFGSAVEGGGYSKTTIQAWADVIERLGISSRPLTPSAAAMEFERHSLERSARDFWLNPSVPPIYDLPLEQLCAQVSSAAEAALDKPTESPHLLLCMVGIQGASQLLELLPKPRKKPAEPPGPATTAPSEASEPTDEVSREALAIAQARNGLVRLIQRRIDALQIGAGAVWRRRLRISVVVVGMVVGILFALSGASSNDRWSYLSYALYGVLGGAMGGFVAMIFRDLTAIVELKRRQP